MRRVSPKSKELTDENPFSLSLGDLMAGLLLIFVLLLSFVMLKLTETEKRQREIVKTYGKLQRDLYLVLNNEFEKDLGKWNAVLNEENLSIRFKELEVLFEQGAAEVRPRFKKILDDFFPRYIGVLRDYSNDIAEIRIEGHTSSEWSEEVSEEEAYILNMELSQDRTRNVLQYVLQIPAISENRNWLKKHLTANGLSSSKLIKLISYSNGKQSRGTPTDQAITTWGAIKTHSSKESPEESRRVEFRVRINAENQLDKIIGGKP